MGRFEAVNKVGSFSIRKVVPACFEEGLEFGSDFVELVVCIILGESRIGYH